MSSKSSFLLVSALAASTVVAQSIYVNLVPEYSSLSSCAEVPVSSIVRDMVKGCGDGGDVTSYSCFCTDSSSHFRSLISTIVLEQCSGNASEASSAAAVFNSYCAVGTVTPQANPPGRLHPCPNIF